MRILLRGFVNTPVFLLLRRKYKISVNIFSNNTVNRYAIVAASAKKIIWLSLQKICEFVSRKIRIIIVVRETDCDLCVAGNCEVPGFAH